MDQTVFNEQHILKTTGDEVYIKKEHILDVLEYLTKSDLLNLNTTISKEGLKISDADTEAKPFSYTDEYMFKLLLGKMDPDYTLNPSIETIAEQLGYDSDRRQIGRNPVKIEDISRTEEGYISIEYDALDSSMPPELDPLTVIDISPASKSPRVTYAQRGVSQRIISKQKFPLVDCPNCGSSNIEQYETMKFCSSCSRLYDLTILDSSIQFDLDVNMDGSGESLKQLYFKSLDHANKTGDYRQFEKLMTNVFEFNNTVYVKEKQVLVDIELPNKSQPRSIVCISCGNVLSNSTSKHLVSGVSLREDEFENSNKHVCEDCWSKIERRIDRIAEKFPGKYAANTL